VLDRKRAEQIQGRRADCQFLAVCIEQNVIADAKLDIAMSAQVIRVVSRALNPAKSQGLKDHHVDASPVAERTHASRRVW
jgi:hypothetical protein